MMNHQERTLNNKHENEKRKVVALLVRFELNVNGVWEEVADPWSIHIAAIRGTVNMDSEKCAEGKLTVTKEERNGKDKDITEKGTSEKFHIKSILRDIIHQNPPKIKY